MKELDRDRAIAAATNYCEKNNLRSERFLEMLCFQEDEEGRLSFLYFPVKDTNGMGLYVDMETQGVPVLIVHSDYTVEETEYTRQYLTE